VIPSKTEYPNPHRFELQGPLRKNILKYLTFAASYSNLNEVALTHAPESYEGEVPPAPPQVCVCECVCVCVCVCV